jgi:hypothetical protein
MTLFTVCLLWVKRMNLDSASKQKDWKFSRPSSKWSGVVGSTPVLLNK